MNLFVILNPSSKMVSFTSGKYSEHHLVLQAMENRLERFNESLKEDFT